VPLPAPRKLTWDLTVELLTADTRVEVPTTVSYTSRDPYALSLAFHLMEPRPVVWRLDRETVLTGSHTPAGSGDVRVEPAEDGKVLLRLGPAGHCASVLCDRDRLTGLVHDSYVLVPPGTEERHIDWRPLLACLGH